MLILLGRRGDRLKSSERSGRSTGHISGISAPSLAAGTDLLGPVSKTLINGSVSDLIVYQIGQRL